MKKVIIQIFISGFGWEVYEKYGFLNNFLPYGIPLKSILGFSSATDPSLFCGDYPSEHGYWLNYYYDKRKSPFKNFCLFYNFLPFFLKKMCHFKKSKKIISNFIRNREGYTDFFNLYNMPLGFLNYFNYKNQKNYFDIGCFKFHDTIFDQLNFRNVKKFISNLDYTEQRNFVQTMGAVKKKEASYIFLYLPNLDAVLHNYGLDHHVVEEKLAFLERKVKELYKKAHFCYKEVDFSVYSNHGMCNVLHLSDLMKDIKKLPLRYGKDYISIYDGTIARFWFFTSQSRQIITDYLNKRKEGKVLSDVDLKSMGVFFRNREYGELIFLLHPHFLMVPSHFNHTMIRGMHGYHPDNSYSHALLLSNRNIDSDIASIVDIKKFTKRKLTANSVKIKN